MSLLIFGFSFCHFEASGSSPGRAFSLFFSALFKNVIFYEHKVSIYIYGKAI